MWYSVQMYDAKKYIRTRSFRTVSPRGRRLFLHNQKGKQRHLLHNWRWLWLHLNLNKKRRSWRCCHSACKEEQLKTRQVCNSIYQELQKCDKSQNRNISRDDENDKKLMFLGWKVLRFWGKDILKNTDECVRTVEEAMFEMKIGELEDD